MSATILVVEDEKLIRWSIRERMHREGYEVLEAPDRTRAAAALASDPCDLMLLDLHLPDGDGFDLLQTALESSPPIPVIVITAHGSVEGAVRAMKAGAHDYISKPFDIDELALTVNRATELSQLRVRIHNQVSLDKQRFGPENIIGSSPSMRQVKALIERVALSPTSTILLQGESGTGKDLAARAIHFTSERRENVFMNISCTSLPEPLLESEIFGHEKGAFTGAHALKKGLFELAEGGTVYLDEVGDMPASLQAKFLRVLEEKAFKRVGGLKDIQVDVRVIAATNKDLAKAMQRGEFREDLYYRLSAIPVALPTLRERAEDIPGLVHHFLSHYCQEFGRPVPDIAPEAMDRLQHYGWPGNVRELRNVIERTTLLCRADRLETGDFMLPRTTSEEQSAPSPVAFRLPREGCDLEEVQRALMIQALERTNGNQTQAAKLLGMSRDQVRYKISKYGLAVPLSSADN